MNFTYNSKTAIEQKRFKIDSFLGVDYASTKINANKSRSIEMKNFINRDGVNRKRYGWNEVAKFTDNLGNPLKINGFWEFKDSLGVEHKIVHVGTKLFKITNLGTNSFDTTYTEIDTTSIASMILDERSYGIVKGDYLYLFLGKIYAMYGLFSGNYEVKAVENSGKVYIPTTTIGISAINSAINSRQSFEEINLLTNKRRNKLIGEVVYGDGIKHGIERYIDNSYFEGSSKYITTHNKGYTLNNEQYSYLTGVLIEIVLLNGTKKTLTFPLTNDGITRNYNAETMQEYHIYNVSLTYTSDEYLTAGIYVGNFTTATITAYLTADFVSYQLDSNGIDSVDKITVNGKSNSIPATINLNTGIIKFPASFLKDNPPSIAGQNNIIVEFTKTINGNSDKINNCRFGQIFGYNDLENLFVSGNSDLPNMDFHSNIPDSTESTSGIPIYDDLTYFGDLSYAVLGSKQSKIMGYTLLEDGTLAIHKEAYKNDPSIYIRQATLDNVLDLSGNIVYDINGNPYKRVVYPQFAGNISEGMITSFASANLSGDKLFLSKNGIYGLVMNENIKSNERFARERSRLINPKLIRETNLQNASAIAYDNRYYLSINGNCYVADSRFKNQYAPEMDDTFSYEWWFWDNVNARIWFTQNGILGFGTENGQLCLFDNELHRDKHYSKIDVGGIMVDTNTDVFTINSSYNHIIADLKDGDTLKLSDTNDYLITSIVLPLDKILSITNGVVKVMFEEFYGIARYLEGKVVYLGTNQPNKYYVVENLDSDNLTFELWENGLSIASDLNLATDISLKLNGLDVYIKNMDYATNSFQVADYLGNIYNVVSYEEQTLNLIGWFDIKENVKSLWATPLFDLGTGEFSKNLHSITLTPEAMVGGKIEFGFKTREKEKEFAVGGVNLFDFNTLDFTTFSLETSTFAKSFTKRLKIKNFNFIQFYFKSDNDKDCVVNNLSITYSLGKLNKGVR